MAPLPRFVLPVVLSLCVALAGIGSAVAAPPHPVTHVSAAAPWTDWYAYHGSGHRSGYAPGMPPSGALVVNHRVTLDGAVYASPIVVKGVTIVTTENDTVYAFGSTWKLLWKQHLGTPSPAAQRPCGNIDPLGITGTPTYAAATGLGRAAEFSGTPPTHQLYGSRSRPERSRGTTAWIWPGSIRPRCRSGERS